MSVETYDMSWPAWRIKTHRIIFGTDTPAGKLFDIILMLFISVSVLVVFLDSIISIHASAGHWLYVAEWFFTIAFTLEYLMRIITVKKPIVYITSFYGIIDLLSILPTYISLMAVGGQLLIVIRILRLLRIFRVLKLGRYLRASSMLLIAVRNSRHKIAVFLWFILIIVVIMGAIMYLVEGPENGFKNIPESIYWAIVTLTTVGYGDISPKTPLGKALASVVMILGYGIIAVPTGIVTAEMAKHSPGMVTTQACPHCAAEGHDPDALHCKHCGAPL